MITLDGTHTAVKLTASVRGLAKKGTVLFASSSMMTASSLTGNFVLATEAEVIAEFSQHASGVPTYTVEKSN